MANNPFPITLPGASGMPLPSLMTKPPLAAPVASPSPVTSPTSVQPSPSSGGLDQKALILTKAIGLQENGGKVNYTSVGDGGTSAGQYQWNNGTRPLQQGEVPANFSGMAQRFNLDPNDFSPENQNKVAYAYVKAALDKGLSPAQVASTWNAGQGEPDAYTGKFSNGNASTTSVYDVPGYVAGVQHYAQQLYGQLPIDNLSHPLSTTPDHPTNSSPSVAGFLSNAVSSAGNFIGGLYNVVTHPIKTVENLASTAAGGVEKIFGANNEDTQNFDNVVHYFAGRYGGGSLGDIVHNIGHTLYTDPVGAALDLSTFLDGVSGAVGAAGKIADVGKAAELAKATDFISTAQGILKSSDPAAIEALRTNGTLTKIANAADTISQYTNPLSAVGGLAKKGVNLAARSAGETMGVSTGAGFGAIKGAFNAGTEGGAAQTAFRAGISGGEEGQDALVASAQDAYRSVKNDQAATYQSQLENIKASDHMLTADTLGPIYDKFDSLLKKFDVLKNEDGTLDFTNSRLASEPGSITDINQISKQIDAYRNGVKDINPSNVDALKQFITDRYTPGSRGSAFTTPLADSVRTVLKTNVPGYEEMTGAYSKTANELKDFKQLSVGGKAGKETIIKKLTSAMRGNNEYRRALLQKFENRTGTNIMSQASGSALRSIVPIGLAKPTEMLAAVVNPHLLMGLPFMSPRLVGEFVNTLGKGNRYLEKIGNMFLKYKGPTAIKVGIINQQTKK